jgi:hypothetical protein
LGPASAVVPLGNAAKATKRNFLNRSFNARASVEEHELSSRVRAGLAVFFPARDGAPFASRFAMQDPGLASDLSLASSARVGTK